MPFKTIGRKTIEYTLFEGKCVLSTLYSQTKTGAVNEWRIWSEGNTVQAEGGQIGGNTRLFPSTSHQGKNIGRSNETSPEEQALSEAHTKWMKKQDGIYTTEKPSEESNEKVYREKRKASPKKVPCGIIKPTLAYKYSEKKHLVNWPWIATPKIDGIRGIARRVDDKVQMQSRQGTIWLLLASLKGVLREVFDEFPEIVLDGEIYSHTIPFRVISGVVRSQKTEKEEEGLLEFWVFDIVDTEMPAHKRRLFLHDMKKKFSHLSRLVWLCGNPVGSEEEMLEKHDLYISKGFEGIMIRKPESVYELNYRSSSLLKYKAFEDAEFKVVDVSEANGTESKAVIFVCETAEGERFSVRPRGSVAKRRWQLENSEKYIGKMLTVRWQPTGGETKPRFGCGIKFDEKTTKMEPVDFRDYE
jgi:ATP-dependent DNA ligase